MFVFEALRYETTLKVVAVPFVDYQGTRREYSANNSHTALFARWLLMRHPGMRVETRRSMCDGRRP